MIVIFEAQAAAGQIRAVESLVRQLDLDVHRSEGAEHTVLGVAGDSSRLDRRRVIVPRL